MSEISSGMPPADAVIGLLACCLVGFFLLYLAALLGQIIFLALARHVNPVASALGVFFVGVILAVCLLAAFY